jgi:hypothetical protein
MIFAICETGAILNMTGTKYFHPDEYQDLAGKVWFEVCVEVYRE